MAGQLSDETVQELRRYLDGELGNTDLADWLTGMEYESAISDEERDTLASVRLVLTEVEEGRRRSDEILARVAELLALSNPDEPVVAERSGSATTWGGSVESTGATSRPQRVGI